MNEHKDVISQSITVKPDQVFFEPACLDYELGRQLKKKFCDLPWIPIESHNNIETLRKSPNSSFTTLKRHLILGVRKTHKMTPNQKVSDFLVPYTSSGCSAMCLYCYLVCNYNKCSYLRLFVNREQMLAKIMKTAKESDQELVFEIGSNSDLVLENTITDNLEWTIEEFSKADKGMLTFPTKFNMVKPLLHLNHRGKVIVRISINPDAIIQKVEFGTSKLRDRILALNQLCESGYRVGILIAPVILMENWKTLYAELIEYVGATLSKKVKEQAFIEVIFMTYSFVHRAINQDAFPGAVDLYDPAIMVGRGRGKYCYRNQARVEGEQFIREQLALHLRGMPILYVV